MRKSGIILSCLTIICLFPCLIQAANEGIITGHVAWEDGGSAIADAKVCVQDPRGDVIGMAQTDPNGLFRIQVPAGRYIISAEKQNFVQEYYPNEYLFKEADPVTLFGGETRHVNILLDLGGWISGNFSYFGANIQLGFLTVIKIDEPYAGWYQSLSLAGPFPSAYAVTGLIPGTYKILGRAWGKSAEFYPGVISFDDATPIQIQEGAGISDISFVLDPVGWGSIQGRAFDAATGEGIGGTRAYVYQWLNYHGDIALDSVVTAPDGTYLFNLPAGNYYVMILYSDRLGGETPVPVYYFSHYNERDAEAVSVLEGQQVTGIDFPIDYSIPHNLTISGSIYNELSGIGLDDVVITAIDYDTGEIMGTGDSYNEGEFIINGLCPRRYLLMFDGPSIIPIFFSRAYSWHDADIITLDRNFSGVRTEAITQDYGDNGLAILGRITINGLPAEGARIYAFPFGQLDPAAFAISDAYGEYSIIGGLAPGQYTVICDMYGYLKEVYPIPVVVDLMTNPIADDINFELMPVSVAGEDNITSHMNVELAGNYPNPFNSQTVISFHSGRHDSYNGAFTVFNLLGQIVGQKVYTVSAGINSIVWNMSDFGSPVSSGVYYYRVDGITGVGRMTLLK